MADTLLTGLRPTHPGEILREDVLPSLGRSRSEIARALRVSRPTLYDVLNEKQPVTTVMALRIGKLTDTSPLTWLRMQAAYDVRIETERMAEELDQIPVLAA